MFLSTIVLYFYVRNLLRTEIEEVLFSTEARIEASLKANNPPYSLPPVVELQVVSAKGMEKLKDTIIFDPSQDEMEEFRELTTFKTINGKNYRITVRTLIVESEDILIAVIFSYLTIIFFVFIIFFYFNKARSQRLWQPFFANLEKMKNFSLDSPDPIALANSNILEFHELSKEIKTLTSKVKSDYLNMKQFTENVSHELQTPLAIIQAKIENIINGDNLNDTQYEHLTSIQKDIRRLTQMNKRLTLLTKIENRQFTKIATVSFAQLLEETIQNFQEITTVEIKFHKEHEISAIMDPYLAEVMCANLISNAIKHNTDNSNIHVTLKDNLLSISNGGTNAIAHPKNIFTRFYKESEGEKSTGLGLAIVKRICNLYGFSVGYEFKDGQHIFIVRIK